MNPLMHTEAVSGAHLFQSSRPEGEHSGFNSPVKVTNCSGKPSCLRPYAFCVSSATPAFAIRSSEAAVYELNMC